MASATIFRSRLNMKMDEDLLRQRRNLLATACVLWVLSASRAEVQSISALGATISIMQPRAAFLGLWVLLGYFLWRYLAFFIARAQHQVAEYVREELRKAAHGAIFEVFGEQYPNAALTGRDWPTNCEVWASNGRLGEFQATHASSPRLIVLRGVRRHMIVAWIARVWRLAVADPITSDYLLPFVLAAGVTIYAGNTDWMGSWANLLHGL